MPVRLAQLRGQRQALRQQDLHLLLEEAQRAAPGRLRLVHGEVGPLQELVRVEGPGGGEHRDADARRRLERRAVEGEGLADLGQHAFGDGLRFRPRRLGLRAQVLEHDHELVAAQSRDEIAGGDAGANPPRRLAQKQVADVMALGVVQDLEVVEVDEEQRAAGAGIGVRHERLPQPLVQHGAVWEPGQRIEIGELVHLRLGALQLRNVGDEAVPQRRPVRLALRKGMGEHPFHFPVGQADAVLALPFRQRLARMEKRCLDARKIVRMNERAQDRAVLRHLFGMHAEYVIQPNAGIGHAGCAVRAHAMLVKAGGEHGRDLVVAVLQLQPADRLGHFAHGPVIVERLAGFRVAHEAHAFLDPDPLARAVPVDLRDEVVDPARLEQHLVDLGAAVRIDVPFRSDIVAAADQLLFRLIAVQADEGGVGADHPAVEGRAENALADVLVEVAEAPLVVPRLQQRAMPVQRKEREAEARHDCEAEHQRERRLAGR